MEFDHKIRNYRDLLKTFGNTDARLEMLAEFLDSRSSSISTDPLVEAKEERRKARERKIQQLRWEYKVLVKRNNLCAAALGACQFCWGEDPECECGGQGVPGSKLPDKDAFEALVLPIVTKMGTTSLDDAKKDLNNQENSEKGDA
jgi:hypothetical protein